jgi:hypothetical protein
MHHEVRFTAQNLADNTNPWRWGVKQSSSELSPGSSANLVRRPTVSFYLIQVYISIHSRRRLQYFSAVAALPGRRRWKEASSQLSAAYGGTVGCFALSQTTPTCYLFLYRVSTFIHRNRMLSTGLITKQAYRSVGFYDIYIPASNCDQQETSSNEPSTGGGLLIHNCIPPLAAESDLSSFIFRRIMEVVLMPLWGAIKRRYMTPFSGWRSLDQTRTRWWRGKVSAVHLFRSFLLTLPVSSSRRLLRFGAQMDDRL